jgi:regulator of protease activity HflC (stomatin/prohibitin superfamily)
MSEKIYYGDETGRHEAKGEQLDYILQAQADAQETQRLMEAEQTAKAEARASAIVKLTALGLNENEINAIIGGI